MPVALADYVESNGLQGKMKFDMMVGASVGAETADRYVLCPFASVYDIDCNCRVQFCEPDGVVARRTCCCRFMYTLRIYVHVLYIRVCTCLPTLICVLMICCAEAQVFRWILLSVAEDLKS